MIGVPLKSLRDCQLIDVRITTGRMKSTVHKRLTLQRRDGSQVKMPFTTFTALMMKAQGSANRDTVNIGRHLATLMPEVEGRVRANPAARELTAKFARNYAQRRVATAHKRLIKTILVERANMEHDDLDGVVVDLGQVLKDALIADIMNC